ncbi:MAG: right-handed parallel beta-helix repeat-containing protein [Microbacteriaceae bacterium]|nr:right-handed parallel beta-helix repeat-containing protein [Microbacteriaceae bacterium]
MTSRLRYMKALAFFGCISLSFGAVLLVASPASATNGTVTTTADSGAGSLRQAILDANADPSADTINITATGTLTLLSDLPAITEPVTINGPGATNFTISAANYNAFNATATTALAVSNLRIENAGLTANVAAISTDTGALSVLNVVTSGSYEGVSSNSNSVQISSSQFLGSVGDGANLSLTGGTSTITDSVFSQSQNGWGVWSELSGSASLNVSNSTAEQNASTGFHFELDDSATVVGSSLTSNDNDGMGIYLETYGSSTGTFSNSDTNDNTDDGIQIDSDDDATLSFTNSTSTYNQSDGFQIDASGNSHVTITGFAISKSDDDGFDLDTEDGAQIVISNGTVLDVGDSGFEADSHDPGSKISATNIRIEGSETGADLEVHDGGMIELLSSQVIASLFNGVTISDSTGADSSIQIDRTTISGTDAPTSDGAGLNILDDVFDFTILLTNSTISGNTGATGGGIYADLEDYDGGDPASLSIVNSTISGNSGEYAGGAYITGDSGAQVFIQSSTFMSNISTGTPPTLEPVYLDGPAVLVQDSIFAGGGFETRTSTNLLINYSLVEDPSVGASVSLAAGDGNLTGVNPLLGPLANNGGSTLTHLPLAGSPVINTGEPSFSGLTTDQRGQTRVVDRLDMGAVEVGPVLAETGSSPVLPIVGGVGLLAIGAVLLRLRRRLAR